MSLRLRLTLVYTAFLALVLVVVAWGVYALTERSLIAQLENRVAEVMRIFASNANLTEAYQALQASEHGALHEFLVYPARPLSAEQVARGSWQSWQVPMSAEGGAPSRETSLWSALSARDRERLAREGQLALRVSGPGGQTHVVQARLLRHSLDNGQENLNFYAAHLIALPTSSIQPILRQLAVNLVTMVVAAFGLFAVGVWLLSGQALLPVKRVTAAAARIGSQDLAQRVPVPKSEDEMSELAVAINHMLARLQESFETQRRFTADASHELRTPVTAIVGHANYLLRRTKPSAEQAESLGVIRGEGERMAKLVNDLLELARADAGFAVKREPMNLVEVVESVYKEVRRTAEGTELALAIPSPIVEVDGDAGRLKQVVLNLVQNALNAGSRHVSVSLTQGKDEVSLEVLADGPGIPAEAIPFLFERFSRVDSARSTRGNGSGLGLAIVKWIVAQHGGEVKVESRLGEGTAFTVLLPAYSQASSKQSAVHPQAFKPVRT
ncbi:hypothetical protein BH24DEI1_BH24DEI1_11750 [soil metagenome]